MTVLVSLAGGVNLVDTLTDSLQEERQTVLVAIIHTVIYNSRCFSWPMAEQKA